jgi:F0F1-type ATP synthase alpha subunit
MMSFIKSRKKEILDTIRTTGKLDDTTTKQLREALTDFAKQFAAEKKD